MKLEKIIKRPLPASEAACILQVLERMGQKKTAGKYRTMVAKAMPEAYRDRAGMEEPVEPVSSRQKILSGTFLQGDGEMPAEVGKYLFLERNLSLHAGIMDPAKDMDSCMRYIVEMAWKQAEKGRKSAVAVRYDVVYGWAADYFTSVPVRKMAYMPVTFTEPEKKKPSMQAGKKAAGKRKQETAARKMKPGKDAGQDGGRKADREKTGGQISLFDVCSGMEGQES